ncbi:type VI secretion system tube protein TssD [Hymenobacter sp.]|uniref:type VI secretion system tube protein TssD n=1 Tax=Hymenobacter sp. TaxID=1898978 RepID=UPI00286B8EF9|nr:type VI secretion system tube protein TssD [Hymenobacter sp.]
MASFSAELRVAGHVFSVLHCTYGVHQATHERGRVSSKARHEPVQLTLAVPDGDLLLAWATDPHRRQAAQLVFLNGAGGAALETLALAGAYCVDYQEEFVAGAVGNGAYVCHLVLSDPDGWTIEAGGPAAAFVAPAAREHGAPAVAADWMAAQPTDPWQGKKQSGKAFLDSPPLGRQQLQQLRVATREQCGAEIVVLKEGDDLLTTMRNLQMRAAFQASTNTVFLQSQATYYEAAHEIKHAQQCATLGVEAYAQQTRLDKETHVYEQLMKEKLRLTPAEIKHATGYINSERAKNGLSPLT